MMVAILAFLILSEDKYCYKWIKDSGHAWLQVPKAEYLLSGFNASPYSYQDDTHVYLEEDYDAEMYLKFNKPNPKDIPIEFYAGNCPVRQMDSIGFN